MPLPMTREITRMKEEDHVRLRPKGEVSGKDASAGDTSHSEAMSSSFCCVVEGLVLEVGEMRAD